MSNDTFHCQMKEDTDKSMKNALCVYYDVSKGTSVAKVRSNSRFI